MVFDADDGRAKLIPRTRNCPGFPEGLQGEALLSRLRIQAVAHGAPLVKAAVEKVVTTDGAFLLETDVGHFSAICVILATGIVDRAPAIPRLRQAIDSGSIRLCPVCDAYEARGQRIGVVGADQSALREALFLKDYSPHVTMLFNHPQDVSKATREMAAQAHIEIWDSVDDLVPRGEGFTVAMANGASNAEIDVIYPSMGCDVRAELAIQLGAHCDDEGYIVVNEALETSVPGLYAIGDVAKGLNQIAVAFGQAATAASHIHNVLRTM